MYYLLIALCAFQTGLAVSSLDVSAAAGWLMATVAYATVLVVKEQR